MNSLIECSNQMTALNRVIKDAGKFGKNKGRPLITLTYAQSLDGSISKSNKNPLAISGEKAFKMTHQLRAGHDAILIGIGTALSDNPMLNVRLVEGDNPTPVILDTNQKVTPGLKMFRDSKRDFYIVSAPEVGSRYHAFYRKIGAEIIRCPRNEEGLLDLNYLLPTLYELGINSIMVEGGARVIGSFLSAKLVDILLLTISPSLIGGYNALSACRDMKIKLKDTNYFSLGDDLIFWGYPDWEAE